MRRSITEGPARRPIVLAHELSHLHTRCINLRDQEATVALACVGAPAQRRSECVP